MAIIIKGSRLLTLEEFNNFRSIQPPTNMKEPWWVASTQESTGLFVNEANPDNIETGPLSLTLGVRPVLEYESGEEELRGFKTSGYSFTCLGNSGLAICNTIIGVCQYSSDTRIFAYDESDIKRYIDSWASTLDDAEASEGSEITYKRVMKEDVLKPEMVVEIACGQTQLESLPKEKEERLVVGVSEISSAERYLCPSAFKLWVLLVSQKSGTRIILTADIVKQQLGLTKEQYMEALEDLVAHEQLLYTGRNVNDEYNIWAFPGGAVDPISRSGRYSYITARRQLAPIGETSLPPAIMSEDEIYTALSEERKWMDSRYPHAKHLCLTCKRYHPKSTYTSEEDSSGKMLPPSCEYARRLMYGRNDYGRIASYTNALYIYDSRARRQTDKKSGNTVIFKSGLKVLSRYCTSDDDSGVIDLAGKRVRDRIDRGMVVECPEYKPMEKTKGYYEWYLKSPEWEALRQKRLKLDDYRCQRCGTAKNVQVHHVTYESLGHEDINDLITLCSKCHTAIHEDDIAEKKAVRYSGKKNGE